MRNILKKTEITFALKVSLLFGLILIASSLKDNKNLNKGSETLVQNITTDVPNAVFTNF